MRPEKYAINGCSTNFLSNLLWAGAVCSHVVGVSNYTIAIHGTDMASGKLTPVTSL